MARILHVDDEEPWRRLVKENLEDHHVDSAESLGKALSLLEANSAYDVALVDLNLKAEGDGGEILDLLRSKYPTTRRIVVTGRPPRGSLRKTIFQRFDADEIIIKGHFDLPDLRIVIEEAVSQGGSALPQALRLNRSALKQRFRDWQRTQGDRLKYDIRVAEEHMYDAAKVSGQSRHRAQRLVDRAKLLEMDFRASYAELRDLLEDIRSVDDLNAALEALEAAEERFGELSLENEIEERGGADSEGR
jgi:CheY-like chemotaxis protein